ncbi:GGDEF domain-containing protein [Thalassotalea euphylliae]|uniref:GGDEF domain-containing protein n=1 Tax=Thalassotalea euphylliae TaxID=1655234 RepID=UPI003631BC11
MKKDWWYRFANYDSSENIDVKRKKLVLSFFTYIGTVFLLIFGFKTPAEATLLKTTLFSAAALFLINLFVLRFHKRLELTTTLTGLSIIPLVLAIVYTGGHQNTGLYWTYPFPITLFIFFGYWRGLVLNLILFAGITFLVFSPELTIAVYRIEEISRYFASYIVNVILCLIAEYFRFKSHSELTNVNIEKQKQANTDALTGLPNRRFVDSVFIEDVISNPSRHFPLSIAILDIDHFKRVNDNYGHDIGDLVLKHVATTIRRVLRESDLVARIGGEEFLLIFRDVDITKGMMVAEKVRAGIEAAPFEKGNTHIRITVSMGCAQVDDTVNFDNVIKTADEHLYQAKEHGRNRVVC